jgi:hypothetical protein
MGNQMTRTTPRKAYNVTLRCRLNGTEFRARLFLRSVADAEDAMYRRARLHMSDREYRLPRDWFHVTEVSVADDQSRPCTR